ncbi:Histone-lysine N-methyltransferase SUV39H1 [Dirofilaria immitis]
MYIAFIILEHKKKGSYHFVSRKNRLNYAVSFLQSQFYVIQNYESSSRKYPALSVMFRTENDESSDDEQEPTIDVGRDENGMYEVERILAKKRLKNGKWVYYIKWVGWPYKRSSWQTRRTFGNMSEVVKEFYDRERALSVVIRRQEQWSQLSKVSQLHSLMRWENEINTILRANGQQILYIHNDVDCARRKRHFTYIAVNKWSAEAKAHVNPLNYTPVRCTCKTKECGSGEKCCPTIGKSKFFYTKRRRMRSRFCELLSEHLVVECYNCGCSNACPTKIVQKGRRYKVAIVRTETRGWGIFALEDIPSNVFVVEYIGEVLTIAEGDSRRDSMYQFELNGYKEIKYLIDAKYYGNEAAFINHSCDPNLVAVRIRVERFDQSFHRIGLFSKCRIFRGQELTLNYFYGKWKPETILTSEEGTMKCFCGALNCMRYWPRLVGNAVDDVSSDEDNKENSFAKSENQK